MSNRVLNNFTSLLGSMSNSDNKITHLHYSGIYRNGKKIYLGSNHFRSTYNGECICFSTHAEMDVLHKLLKDYTQQPFKDVIKLKNCCIIVARVTKDGTIRNSRPCNNCLDMMSKYNIKNIIYSTDDGFFIVDKPQNMEKLHSSSGWNTFKDPSRLNKPKKIPV
uniref:Uncharacterized protein n=1 Tax=viral metagenome TaxID=1070528 RepID=A0A6C0IAY0_9ZZZZ